MKQILEKQIEIIPAKLIKIIRSAKGIPCIWNKLKDVKNSGEYAVYSILLNSELNVYPEENAIYKSTSNKSDYKNKLLFPIHNGDYILKIFNDADGIKFSLFLIEEIATIRNLAIAKLLIRGNLNTESYTFFENHEYTEIIENILENGKQNIHNNKLDYDFYNSKFEIHILKLIKNLNDKIKVE